MEKPKKPGAIKRRLWNAHTTKPPGIYLCANGFFYDQELRSIHRYIGKYLAWQKAEKEAGDAH